MELRARGPAGRVRRGARDARSRPHARLAPPARRLADAGAHAARGGSRARLHIETLVGRYAGRIGSWDVVNEAVADGGGLRDTCFLRVCGEGHIAEAFRLAHAADPAARLYYNDYGAEGVGRKSDAVYALVRAAPRRGRPRPRGRPPDAPPGGPPAEAGAVAANVRRLRDLGLEVRISEMDVRIRRIRRRDPLALQRRAYHDAIAACAGLPGFAGVTFWGVSDRHSWIHGEFGEDAPLLFDRGYLPKPAYFGVRDALGRRLRTPRPSRSRASSRRTTRPRSRSPRLRPRSPSRAGPSGRARRGPRSSSSGRS